MLIPRFSIRLLLAVTTVCALFFFVVTLAIQGSFWAIALSTAVAGLLATFVVHALVFFFAWLLASMSSSVQSGPRRQSPFATASPPEQIIPPLPPTE